MESLTQLDLIIRFLWCFILNDILFVVLLFTVLGLSSLAISYAIEHIHHCLLDIKFTRTGVKHATRIVFFSTIAFFACAFGLACGLRISYVDAIRLLIQYIANAKFIPTTSVLLVVRLLAKGTKYKKKRKKHGLQPSLQDVTSQASRGERRRYCPRKIFLRMANGRVNGHKRKRASQEAEQSPERIRHPLPRGRNHPTTRPLPRPITPSPSGGLDRQPTGYYEAGYDTSTSWESEAHVTLSAQNTQPPVAVAGPSTSRSQASPVEPPAPRLPSAAVFPSTPLPPVLPPPLTLEPASPPQDVDHDVAHSEESAAPQPANEVVEDPGAGALPTYDSVSSVVSMACTEVIGGIISVCFDLAQVDEEAQPTRTAESSRTAGIARTMEWLANANANTHQGNRPEQFALGSSGAMTRGGDHLVVAPAPAPASDHNTNHGLGVGLPEGNYQIPTLPSYEESIGVTAAGARYPAHVPHVPEDTPSVGGEGVYELELEGHRRAGALARIPEVDEDEDWARVQDIGEPEKAERSTLSICDDKDEIVEVPRTSVSFELDLKAKAAGAQELSDDIFVGLPPPSTTFKLQEQEKKEDPEESECSVLGIPDFPIRDWQRAFDDKSLAQAIHLKPLQPMSGMSALSLCGFHPEAVSTPNKARQKGLGDVHEKNLWRALDHERVPLSERVKMREAWGIEEISQEPEITEGDIPELPRMPPHEEDEDYEDWAMEYGMV